MTMLDRIMRAVFGAHRYKHKAHIFVRISRLIVAIDFATKGIALLTLREGHRVVVFDGALLFELSFNATSLGTGGRAQAAATGLAPLVGALVCLAALSAVSLAFASSEQGLWRKVLLLVGLVTVTAILAAPVGAAVYGGLGGAAIVPAAKMLAGLASNLLFLRLARGRSLFVILAVLTSANLANAVNFVAHPRGVIDFAHIAMLGRWFGIANIADYVMGAALVILVVFVPVRLAIAVLRSAWPDARPELLAWVDEPLTPMS